MNQIPVAQDHGTYTDKGVICVVTGYGQTEKGVSNHVTGMHVVVLTPPEGRVL